MAAANGLALLDPSLELGLAARVLMGLGTGAGFVAGIDLVRSGKGGPFWQGAYGGATMAAGGLALMVVPQLVGSLGWRAPYWTGLVLAVAGALPVLAAERAGVPRHPDAHEACSRSVLGDRRLWPLGAVQMATFGLSVVAGNWIVTLLEHRATGATSRASSVGSSSSRGSSPGRPVGSRSSETATVPGRSSPSA